MFDFGGDTMALAVMLTTVMVLFIFGLTAFLIIVKSKQNKKAREYLRAVIEERENTMSQISTEVHDNLTQMLSLTRMNLHMLKDRVDSKLADDVARIGGIVDTLILDTQNISHTLNPEYLKYRGLIPSLEEEVDWVNLAKKINCKLTLDYEPYKLDGQTELMIYRIVQEAIHNCIKYAEATSLDIILSFGKDQLQLTVSDNGIGFDIDENKLKGIGVSSMSQRAKIIGGSVTLVSKPGVGTTVVLFVPKPKR
jgi:signal transduction histidine kinase